MCEKKYGIKVHIGFEAKALSTRGAIDASTEMCSQASVRLGAVHRIPKGEEEYRYLSREEVRKDPVLAYDNWLSTTLAMIANSDVDIIAHPCFAPFKYGLEIQSEDVRTLFKQACQYEKKLELSQRYPECNGPLLDIVGKAPMLGQILSFGSDAHSVQDLRNAFRKLVE
jgi:histidinol phosphatase-like PHP family hydrolase